jgi:hypothetical protein
MASAQDEYQGSWFAHLLSRWRHHLSRLGVAVCRLKGRDHPPPADALADVPRHSYDASLLFRRMTFLQIDRDALARDEPLMLRELQGFCTLCASKTDCVADLEQESATGEPQEWREYCPNFATLNALGALQNRPRAAQYLKTPRHCTCRNRAMEARDG